MRVVVRTLILAALALAGQAPQPLQAQAFQGPKEPRGFDFRPEGAWRKEAKRVREARRGAIARGDLRLANSGSASMSVTGDYRLPVVFLNFSDTVAAGFQLDTAAYGRLFFSIDPSADSRPYSLKTFYEELSNSNITIDGDQYGWIPAPATFTKAFVGQACHAVGVGANCAFSPANRFGAWLVNGLDSLNSATLQVDWAQYDHDNDGIVDFVTFIHPTIGGECSGISTAADIWAHRWSLSSLRGSPYVTKTPWPGHAGQFIRIDDYIIQSSRGGNSGCTAASMMPIGTMAHETGHAFGIPDLYDTSNNDEGIGEWGLMGSGNYTVPKSPSSMEGWSLQDLGWVTIASAAAGSVTLGPVQTADSVLRVPFTGTDEFLILENRQALQSDSAQMDPGRPTTGGGGQQKAPGLLIWHVDQSIIDGGRASNSVNSGVNKGLRLVQADGLANLQDPGPNGNRGDRGDAFPGLSNVTSASPTTNPALLASNGRVGRTITAITQVSPSGPMSFTLSPSQFRLLATTVGNGTIASSGGGTLSVGVFTDSATTTTLTAHPGGGAAFTGWTGDTTGTDTVMVLPVRRPYNLTANFTGVVAVTYDQATNAILGLTPLTGPQATYLDDVGNNNNVYDLGDYLAYLKANAIVASPQVLRQLGVVRPLTPTRER